jgi:endoglucanase
MQQNVSTAANVIATIASLNSKRIYGEIVMSWLKIKTILVASTAILMASCGDDGTNTVGSNPAPSPAPVAPQPTPPAPVTPPQPSRSLTQDDAQIGACVNMGNHLEPPNEGDWGRPINKTDFADIAAKGFKTVRLPVRFSGHAGTSAPYTIDAKFMNRVVEVVDQARAAKLRVILDLHNYDELMADPAANTARFVGLWKQIAARFSGYDDNLWFELMNEPHKNLTNANLLTVFNPALAEIRSTNPNRKVVIGGEFWSGIRSLATLPFPDDRNIIATFHYYEPFNFTHQGATWVDPSPPLGATFGSAADLDRVNQDVQKAKDFMQRTGRPVFIGEFGAHSTVSRPERAAYYKAINDAYKAAKIDGCVWGYANAFPIRDPDTGEWYQEMLSAIGL